MRDTLSKLQYMLMKEGLQAEGRSSAFKFALECNEDLKQIQNEAETRKEYLQIPPDIRPDLAKGATPRIYQEAYLKGLEDAIELILRMNSENKS